MSSIDIIRSSINHYFELKNNKGLKYIKRVFALYIQTLFKI